jgi:hypothetical protein
MSARTGEYYRTDAEFDAAVGLINTQFDPDDRYRLSKARAEHVDEYGDTIKPDEEHFSRRAGFRNDIKLSRLSMERHCYTSLHENRRLVAAAQESKRREDQRYLEEMRSAYDRSHPRSRADTIPIPPPSEPRQA